MLFGSVKVGSSGQLALGPIWLFLQAQKFHGPFFFGSTYKKGGIIRNVLPS